MDHVVGLDRENRHTLNQALLFFGAVVEPHRWRQCKRAAQRCQNRVAGRIKRDYYFAEARWVAWVPPGRTSTGLTRHMRQKGGKAMADTEVDARGLNCPLPILRARKALNDMQSGQT